MAQSCNADYVSSNAKSSLFGAMLYIFDDNEAVTELLWFGCLTELILTPRFRLGTLTPNINSHTHFDQR